ncbi:MAG: Cas10/Cmr2 second palm domain-containing protein [Pseudonocardiaceae bacterium]
MCDLVVVALPGVQRLISEARSTADVQAGSAIVAHLATAAAGSIQGQDRSRLVIPHQIGEPDGMPNRVVALVPNGRGEPIAQDAVAVVKQEWQKLLDSVFGSARPTPGMPIAVWVCVPDGDGRGYEWQWARAQALLTARRRVRDFAEVQRWPQRAICTLSPRWPAEEVPPPNLKPHEQATLSATNWVRRRWPRIQNVDRFPSTPSIASAPFRQEVLKRAAKPEISTAITALRQAVTKLGLPGERQIRGLSMPAGSGEAVRWFARSGGPWVYLERWQPQILGRDTGRDAAEFHALAAEGRTALEQLRAAAKKHGVPGPPTSYLAIVVQDLDGMGGFLNGEVCNAANTTLDVDPDVHRGVSGRLGALATAQRGELRGSALLGVPVYIGGDDLLAFTPALTALDAAQRCHDRIPPELPRASTAVLFFHYQSGLQSALTRAREMLETAKEQVPGKHGLAVGYLRRSGAHDLSVLPWVQPNGQSAVELFRVFGRDAVHPMSPRLVADLQRDADELDALSRRDSELHGAELTRLVRRHLGGEETGRAEAAKPVAAALLELGTGRELVGATRIGVFLRQEAAQKGWGR